MPNSSFNDDVREAANAALLGTLPAPAVSTAATGLGKVEDAPHVSGDVGVMLLGVRNDVLASTLSGNNGDYSPVSVDGRGVLYTRGSTPQTSAVTSVTLTAATSATVSAATGTKLGLIIFNGTGQPVFLRFGTGAASTTDFSIKLAVDAIYEVPFGYAGALTAFSTLASVSPHLMVTTITL